MSRELKGLLAALIAGLAAVGVCYGLSAALAPSRAEHPDHHRSAKNQSAKKGGSAPVSAALVSQGAGLYAKACASCHGDGGAGGYGPRLINTDQSGAQITAIIQNGIKPKMPAFGGKYTPPQIQAMTVYVQSLKK